MEPEDHILKQLKEQNIEYNILQKEYDPNKESLVSKTIQKWVHIFQQENQINRRIERKKQISLLQKRTF